MARHPNWQGWEPQKGSPVFFLGHVSLGFRFYFACAHTIHYLSTLFYTTRIKQNHSIIRTRSGEKGPDDMTRDFE